MPLYTTTPGLNAGFWPLMFKAWPQAKQENLERSYLKVAVYLVILPWVTA